MTTGRPENPAPSSSRARGPGRAARCLGPYIGQSGRTLRLQEHFLSEIRQDAAKGRRLRAEQYEFAPAPSSRANEKFVMQWAETDSPKEPHRPPTALPEKQLLYQ